MRTLSIHAGIWNRLLALSLVLALLSAACHPGSSRPAPDDRVRLDLAPTPGANVLIVSFDALRADALGVYGNDRGTSPHLDRWARDALVFDRAQAAGPSTPHSFAAAFTGKLPLRVFRAWRLDDGPTLASLFAAAGYVTAFFSGNVQLVSGRNFQQGFDHYDLPMSKDLADEDRDGIPDDEVILRRAQAWIEQHDGQRFFAWVHFLSPHSPYTYREESRRFYDEAYRGPFERTTGHTFEIDSDADLSRARDLYDGEVFHADRLFAALMETVERLRLRERTVIVLTADHGEEFLEHGGLQHSSLYEEVLRIPLIIDLPGVAGGSRTAVRYSNVDLLPTLAHLAALELETEVDGVSLAASHDPRRLLVASDYASFVVTRGSSKLIASCRRDTAAELYDLARDPEEQQNLAVEAPELHRELRRELTRWIGEAPCSALRRAYAGAPPTLGLTEEEVAKLAALGYLDRSGDGWTAPDPRFSATPNPIPDCDGNGLGVTTLEWDAPTASSPLEVRVISPDGKAMTRSGLIGQATTGEWVRHGMRFFLVEVATNEVVASTVVEVTPCHP